MIQDIFPKKLDNSFQKKMPTETSCVVAFQENAIYINMEKQIKYLTCGEFWSACENLHMEIPQCVYLFSIDATDYFLTEIPEGLIISGFAFHKMFETRAMRPKERVLAAATAWHLYVWYRDNKHCGRCGSTLVHSDKLRMLKCPCCGNMVFPKIAPAVIVAVTDGDKILVTKYANREYKKYALIAGFTEIGETAEETVAREVMEEVGLKVKNIRYYKSQPWGFDSNLLLGYFCELDGKKKIHMDEDELSVAEWISGDEIPDDPEGLSLTREMMTQFRESIQQFAENKQDK